MRIQFGQPVFRRVLAFSFALAAMCATPVLQQTATANPFGVTENPRRSIAVHDFGGSFFIWMPRSSRSLALTETGAPVPILRHSPLLQPYASRGFLYSFLGLIGVQEAYSERVRDVMKAHGDEFHISWAPLFLQVTAWLVLSSGVVYLVLGICCLQRVRDRLHQNELDAWRQYRVDLREWQQRFG